jgi:hypothetical protein
MTEATTMVRTLLGRDGLAAIFMTFILAILLFI